MRPYLIPWRHRQRGFLINPYALAVAGGGGGDPDFASVVALLHFDGTTGSQVYTDVKGKTWTENVGGTSALSTVDKKFGTASWRCIASGNGYFSTPSHADFGYGVNPFTVEFWINPDAVSGTYFMYDQRALGAGSGNGIILARIGTALWLYANGNWRLQIAGGVPTAGVWYHLAYSRYGSGGSAVGNLFVNGTSIGTWNDTINYAASNVVIGGPADNPTTLQHTGYLDDLRITKGVARYTANFTPPAAAFPDS